MSYFIRNTTATDIEIDDLGLTLEVGVDEDLRSEPVNSIALSDDLRGFITAGSIVVLDPADSSTPLNTVDSLAVVDSTNSAPYGVVGVAPLLDQLKDVSVPAPTHDFVLTYDNPSKEWQAKISQGGGGTPGDSTSVRETVTQTAHGFDNGSAVYYSTTTLQYELALADDVITLATGIIEVTGLDTFDYVSVGDISTMSGLVEGEWYYLSDVIVGTLTTIEPSTFSNPLGYAESPTKFHVVSLRAQDLTGVGGSQPGVSKKLVVQNAHGFITGQPVYLAADGLYKLAQANDVITLGTALVEIVDGNSFYLVDDGDIENMSGLVTGSWYYVSDTVAGTLTTTEPTTYSNPMGYADSPTQFHAVFARAVDLTGGVDQDTNKKIITQVAHGFTTGQPIYFDGTVWQLAQSNSINTLATEVTVFIDTDNFEAVSLGNVTGLSNLTPGNWYFVDDSTPGVLINSEPTISNPVGVAETTSKLFVIPMRAIDYTNA